MPPRAAARQGSALSGMPPRVPISPPPERLLFLVHQPPLSAPACSLLPGEDFPGDLAQSLVAVAPYDRPLLRVAEVYGQTEVVVKCRGAGLLPRWPVEHGHAPVAQGEPGIREQRTCVPHQPKGWRLVGGQLPALGRFGLGHTRAGKVVVGDSLEVGGHALDLALLFPRFFGTAVDMPEVGASRSTSPPAALGRSRMTAAPP